MTKLTPIPIGATAAWIAALEGADCQCQCTAAVKRHNHTHVGGRCTVKQGVAGGLLHLLADGAVMCGPCANHSERSAVQTTPAADYGQQALFAP